MISVLLQLLFLLFLLIVIGEPFRCYLLRRLRVFSDLDFIQACIIDVFLGGLVLFVLAIVPLGLFSLPILSTVIVLCLVFSLIFHAKSLRNLVYSSKKGFFAAKKNMLIVYFVTLLIFLIFLLINLYPVSGYVFGSIRDESIHSLYVQVLLENHYIPLTLTPYLPEGIIYPQASHAIFAFASSVLSLEVPQAILYVSALFKSLAVLGAYFLGKKLGKGTVYTLGLTFIFAFISIWPLDVTWGANPFIVGFPLYLICLGLLFDLIKKHNSKHDYIEFLCIGLLFGYAGALILSYFEILIVISLFVFVYFLVKEQGNRLRVIGKFGLALAASLIPLSPFLTRFIFFYNEPNHNIGLPLDIPSNSSGLGQLPKIAVTSSPENLLNGFSSNVVLGVLIAAFILYFIASTLINKEYLKNDDLTEISIFALTIFASGLILVAITFYSATTLNIISFMHQGILLSIPLYIIILNFFVRISEHIGKSNLRFYKISFLKGCRATLLVTIIILSLLVAPFMYVRFSEDIESVRQNYAVYAVTTQSDYELMLWMKNNLAFSDTLILVHPFGSGTFIPSVSHLKIIYPYTLSSYSQSYQNLVNSIGNKTLNATTYQLMRDLNISYIFVGSAEALSNDFHELGLSSWDPDIFLGNPNFELVKNYNDSYLFKVEITDQNVTFLDNFEYANWSQNLWQFNCTGNGFGNVTINLNDGLNGSSSLQITSQAIPATGEFEAKYACWVNRTIFAPNNLNTTISFYVNATNGFGEKDTFAILISDSNLSKTVVITTPNGIYQNYSNAITLSSYDGVFSYNLSELWEQVYDLPLPKTLIIALENTDFDGIQNDVTIDDITVKSFFD